MEIYHTKNGHALHIDRADYRRRAGCQDPERRAKISLFCSSNKQFRCHCHNQVELKTVGLASFFWVRIQPLGPKPHFFELLVLLDCIPNVQLTRISVQLNSAPATYFVIGYYKQLCFCCSWRSMESMDQVVFLFKNLWDWTENSFANMQQPATRQWWRGLCGERLRIPRMQWKNLSRLALKYLHLAPFNRKH